jgi:hypothetical protein
MSAVLFRNIALDQDKESERNKYEEIYYFELEEHLLTKKISFTADVLKLFQLCLLSPDCLRFAN